MEVKPKVYFRADGSAQIGLGHVMRCIALAEILSTDFSCHFIIQKPLSTIKKRILEVCIEIIELEISTNYFQEAQYITQVVQKKDIIVLDGYNYGTAYQNELKKHSIKIVSIDDTFKCHFVADAVINHAPGLIPSTYSAESTTRFCLGFAYSLLRRPFLEAATKDRTIGKIENAFICLGGSDFNNITIKILQDLKENNSKLYKVHIVLGGANLYKEKVKQFSETITSMKIFLYENLSPVEMVEVMKKADIGIVSASSILYEVAAVKMPVISGFYVENQLNVYKGFKELGLIYGVGDLNEFTGYSDLINRIDNKGIAVMLKKQKKHINGSSNDNLKALFQSL